MCSSCGAAGHIARDCRQKRPGQGGPPLPGDRAKIDEEYMSLMAELGEGPPPEQQQQQTNGTNIMKKTTPSFNMFEQQMAPRPLMAPPMMPPGSQMPPMPPMNGMAPPPWSGGAPHQAMSWQPGPPGKFLLYC